MTKGYCVECGSWENLHDDGKCTVHHYGHEEGRAYPTAGTPEAVARETGATVDVEFPAQQGDYAEAKRREATEARQRAENEPVLGKLTSAGEEAEGGKIQRVSPAGADANDRREAPNRALDAEVQAAVANVKGLERDVEALEKPVKVSDIDPKQAGDADLKEGVGSAISKDRKATEGQARETRETRETEQRQAREAEEREARAARGGATATSTTGAAASPEGARQQQAAGAHEVGGREARGGTPSTTAKK